MYRPVFRPLCQIGLEALVDRLSPSADFGQSLGIELMLVETNQAHAELLGHYARIGTDQRAQPGETVTTRLLDLRHADIDQVVAKHVAAKQYVMLGTEIIVECRLGNAQPVRDIIEPRQIIAFG